MSEIPKEIYYSPEHDNFYYVETHHGMGLTFWEKWRHRKHEFPKSPVIADKSEVKS